MEDACEAKIDFAIVSKFSHVRQLALGVVLFLKSDNVATTTTQTR